MVSEAEIPLAILHCSLQKYCNPAYKFGKLLKRLKPKCDSSKILNLDTQDIVSNVKILPKIISNVSINTDLSIEKSKHTIKIIPDSYNDLKSQELLSIDFNKQSIKEVKCNESQCIKETKNTSDDKIFMKTIDLNNQDTCITRIISESSEDFNSQESSNEDFNNISVRELKCNEQCIEEKDIFNDTPIIDKNIKIMQSKQNIVNIPETNRNISESSSFLNILSKSTQDFSENLEIKKNENIQKFEESKDSVVNKKIKLNEVNSEKENFLRNSKLKEIKSNINNCQNSTQTLTDNKSDDIFEINNSKDENMEIQIINSPCKDHFHTDINDKNCKIVQTLVQTLEENRKRSKKTCKTFNENDIDEEFTISIRKKSCVENSNVELITINVSFSNEYKYNFYELTFHCKYAIFILKF